MAAGRCAPWTSEDPAGVTLDVWAESVDVGDGEDPAEREPGRSVRAGRVRRPQPRRQIGAESGVVLRAHRITHRTKRRRTDPREDRIGTGEALEIRRLP